jgi:HKD family nuclease
MAKKEFILQGFTKRTHLAAIGELFDVDDVERVILSVAFVSENGVEQIEHQLKAHGKHLHVFAGIRNDITSHQGLARLHAIAGSKLYTVDTGSRNILFHPKLYLVRGKTRARAVIGSANLTLGGLNNNIEAGMIIDFDLANNADNAVVEKIESDFAALPADHPVNVVQVSAIAVLDAMLASGRIVDELAVPPPRPTTSASASGPSDTIPRIKLKVRPLHPRQPHGAKKSKPAKAASPAKAGTPALKAAPATVGVEYEIMWQSKELEERDLQIPTGTNTHATGSMSLDQGLLDNAIDFQRYFRDNVFYALDWNISPRYKSTEEGKAIFRITISGINYGEFTMTVKHSIGKSLVGITQRNALSGLRWGVVKPIIARKELLKRTATIYRDKADPTRFLLDID